MIGRQAYYKTWDCLSNADVHLFGAESNPASTRRQVRTSAAVVLVCFGQKVGVCLISCCVCNFAHDKLPEAHEGRCIISMAGFCALHCSQMQSLLCHLSSHV